MARWSENFLITLLVVIPITLMLYVSHTGDYRLERLRGNHLFLNKEQQALHAKQLGVTLKYYNEVTKTVYKDGHRGVHIPAVTEDRIILNRWSIVED